jgi:Sec-independent protein translocase protein TatA
MKRIATLILAAVFLFFLPHRLPAPIRDEQESPTAAREHSRKPRPKATEAESSAKSKSKPAATAAARKFN